MKFSWQRTFLSLAALGLLFWTACNLAPAPTMMSPDGKNPASAKLGPHKITLANNTTATLSDYQGKVVVLDFWATYCPPCVKAMPDLEALHQKHSAQGLSIIGLNVGGEEDRAGTPDFLRNNKINVSYTLAHLNDDDALFYYTGSDSRIPQTFVYDRQGNLVKQFVGYNDKIKQDLETAIECGLRIPLIADCGFP